MDSWSRRSCARAMLKWAGSPPSHWAMMRQTHSMAKHRVLQRSAVKGPPASGRASNAEESSSLAPSASSSSCFTSTETRQSGESRGQRSTTPNGIYSQYVISGFNPPLLADNTSLQSLSQCPSFPLVELDAIMWIRISWMLLLRPGSDSWSSRVNSTPSRPTSFKVTSAQGEQRLVTEHHRAKAALCFQLISHIRVS